MYGIVIIAVSLSNVLMSKILNQINGEAQFGLLYNTPDIVTVLDLAIKGIGLLLAITVYPPSMVYAILIDLVIISVAQWQMNRNYGK